MRPLRNAPFGHECKSSLSVLTGDNQLFSHSDAGGDAMFIVCPPKMQPTPHDPLFAPAFSWLPHPKQALAVFLSVSLSFSTLGLDGCKKEQPQSQQAQQAQGQAPATTNATPTPDQLYQLVAPIALFPDNLVALVLAGSTFPDQITVAQQWLQQNSGLKGQQLMETVNQQSWDNSVKGLTQFPDVLGQMSSNLSWTSALGDAYFNVPQSVMNAVQVMRQRAYQAGNLKNTAQQNVSVQNEAPGAAPPAEASSGAPQTTIVQPPPQTIVIQPAQPDVVYVPTYNPTVVYGAPVAVYPGYVVPTYSTGAMVATGLISFGVGMAIGASMNNGCCGWGYNSWGCGWHNSSVTYNRNVYVSNSNTFVNRNNYYNRNNINTANINNVNRNNINNVNRNNNYRANNFNSNARPANFTEPKFNQNRNQPQYQNNRGNMAQNNNRQNLAQNNNRGNLAQNNRQPNFNQQNRPGAAENQNRPANQPQRDASRGYGQQPSRGASNNAFGNYSQGGNARTNSARGQQSLQGNRPQQNAVAANRGGGGASRPQPPSRPQPQAHQGGARRR
jgi:hypothetical protein